MSLISGHRAAKVFEPVHWLREACRRAQYMATRESFIEQLKPQGGIDLAIIDMLTQSFYLYLYWNEVSVTRTEMEVRAEPPAWIKERAYRDQQFPRERGHGYWNPPYAHEREAVEHATQMADRCYQRAFQRTLCAMRDLCIFRRIVKGDFERSNLPFTIVAIRNLRRYSTPVTINNPQQVNIAAGGGRQVNAVEFEP